jgi:hypothetical protein
MAIHSSPSAFSRETLENQANLRENRALIANQDWMMGGKQLGFGDYEQSTATKQTKKEKFLAEMDKVCLGRR